MSLGVPGLLVVLVAALLPAVGTSPGDAGGAALGDALPAAATSSTPFAQEWTVPAEGRLGGGIWVFNETPTDPIDVTQRFRLPAGQEYFFLMAGLVNGTRWHQDLIVAGSAGNEETAWRIDAHGIHEEGSVALRQEGTFRAITHHFDPARTAIREGWKLVILHFSSAGREVSVQVDDPGGHLTRWDLGTRIVAATAEFNGDWAYAGTAWTDVTVADASYEVAPTGCVTGSIGHFMQVDGLRRSSLEVEGPTEDAVAFEFVGEHLWFDGASGPWLLHYEAERVQTTHEGPYVALFDVPCD